MGGIFIDNTLREAASVGSSDVEDEDSGSNEVMHAAGDYEYVN